MSCLEEVTAKDEWSKLTYDSTYLESTTIFKGQNHTKKRLNHECKKDDTKQKVYCAQKILLSQ